MEILNQMAVKSYQTSMNIN